MIRTPEPADLSRAVPCPVCGYDLRGHPDITRCPECGQEVQSSEAMLLERRWVDRSMVDLWSISILQIVGVLAALISVIAIARGQYLAVVLGVMALVYLAASALWYTIALVAAVSHHRRPAFALVDVARKVRLRRWICIDGLLILWPIILLTLWRVL